MGSLNSGNTGPLFFNDFLRGAGGLIAVNITKFAAVSNQHLINLLFGFVNSLYQLCFKLMNIFMESRCCKK